MTRRLAMAAFLVSILLVRHAGAQCGTGTPFGGDDSGCIPPDDDNLKYETKVGKNLTKFQKCVLKCHERRASGRLPDSNAEENCENGCTTKYDTANSKLTPPTSVPPGCLNTFATRNVWAAQLDANNSQIYCEGTTPFGGDDTGFLPSSGTIFKCEKKLGKNLAKLLKCQASCHEKRAKGQLADPTEEEACEDDCAARYDTAAAKLVGCDPCTNPNTARDTFRSLGDTNNNLIYCAQ